MNNLSESFGQEIKSSPDNYFLTFEMYDLLHDWSIKGKFWNQYDKVTDWNDRFDIHLFFVFLGFLSIKWRRLILMKDKNSWILRINKDFDKFKLIKLN
jgi:hypothetical protein